MVATALDNVIRFPDGGRVPASGNERILADCRDLAARRLREALRVMLEKVADDLLQRGDVADDRERRGFLYGLKDTLVERGGRLEAQLAAQWTREFNAVLGGRRESKADGELRLEDLQIVDDRELDEELILKSIAQRLQDKCTDELYGLRRRLGLLVGKEDPANEDNPAAPEVFTRALHGALREADFDLPSRLELSRCIGSRVTDHLGPIYHELNAYLVRFKVLPNLRRGYSHKGGHVPGAAKAAASGDIFALLQRLVGVAPAGAGVQASSQGGPGSAGLSMPAGVGGMAFSGGPGAAPGGGGPGGSGVAGAMMSAVPTEQVWASLESLQRSVPSALFAPAAAGMPVATTNVNVLHEFRASPVGQGLAQLDAITVDIVAMLFDMIFDDREIADPIKALVGRLQIPVLKVAMLDKSFFSSKAHPARRLLDVISRAAIAWGRDVRHDDPMYLKIAEIIDRLHDEFHQDTALFDVLCADLEVFLASQEDLADARAAQAAPLVAQRERRELAAQAVDEVLQPLLAEPVPPVVGDLLCHELRTLLFNVRLESGGVGEAWDAAVKTASDLVASVRPQPDVQERRALSRLLPVLVKQIGNAFDRLGVDADRRHAVFDALFTVHAAVLRGMEPVQPEPQAEVASDAFHPAQEPAIVASSEQAEDGITLESITLSAPPLAPVEASEDVDELQRGDWVEFRQDDGTAVRYRLSWISPQRGIYLFTNPQSPRALAISPEALALQVQRGEAMIVPVEPIFDRAVGRALEALQAA